MCCMLGRRRALVVARRSRRPRNTTLLRSHRSSLRNTVISAGRAARPGTRARSAASRTSRYESPYSTKNASPSSGSARRSAPPVPSSVGPSMTIVEPHAPARAVAERLLDLLAEMADAEHDVGDALSRAAARAGARRTGCPPTSTSDLGNRLGERPQAASPRPPARIATGSITRTAPSCPRSRSGSALPRGRPRHGARAAAGDPRRRTSGSRRRPRRPACRRSRRSCAPSSYHSSICGLLMPPERRFLCSQCSCISSPKLGRVAALERLPAAQPELLDVVQVRRSSRASLLLVRVLLILQDRRRRCARSR